MSIKNSARLRAVAVGLGVAAAAIAPSLSDQASAQSVLCQLDVVSLRARDLQESGGDEIFLRLNGQAHPRTGEVNYTNNAEDDVLAFNDKIGETLVENCTGTKTGARFTFQDSTAIYELIYNVAFDV